MATMAEAKRDFKFGLIKGAKIFDQMGYLVVDLQYSINKNEDGFLSDARTRQPRQFKSWDTAIRALRDIGFEVKGVSVA